MSSLEKLKLVGKPKSIISIKMLNLKEKYNIVKAEKCKTDFGEKILVELEDCKVYLPKRFTTHLPCKDINDLSKCSMEILEPYGLSFLIDFHEKQEPKISPLKKFRSVGQKQNKQKPIKKLTELPLKKKFNILKAKRYSHRIMVELEDCKVNLPKRFTKELACEDIKDLTTCSMELLEPIGKSFSIDFHEIKEANISFSEKFKPVGLDQKQDAKPFKPLKELELKKNYNIYNAKKYNSQFGEQIMVELEDCKVNLPKRFTSALDCEDIMNLSTCSMELLAPDGLSFLIDFHEKEETTQKLPKEEVAMF